jgi:anti-sigma regulatory factor (Ser/Thr protein kinase)
VSVELQGTVAQRRHLIDEETKVGEARRDALRLAQAHRLDDTVCGRVAIVATELANNLLQHGGGGELLLQPIVAGNAILIEVLAIDRGRGMQNVDSCLNDGYSTGGTPGTGLGAVRRLAAEFDVYSIAEEGTVVMARVGAGTAAGFGAISVPMPGESECGDSWRLATDGDTTVALVVDGLGHGPLAAQAAQCSAAAFGEAPFEAPGTVIERVHRRLAGTRGAAAACARIEPHGSLCYAGVGNISASLVTPDKSQGLASHNGTLGLRMPRVQQFEYQRAPRARIVMHSDGISARWDLARKHNLFHRHPATIAAVLYRDHKRGRDDATVLVLA